MRIRIAASRTLCASDLRFPGHGGYGPVMSVLADNIRLLRMRYANQSEFGDLFPVSQPTVARWEKGSHPTVGHLQRLAEIAGTTFEMLVTTPLADIPMLEAASGAPSPADLEAMIATAVKEVPVGSGVEVWTRIVASSLHDQLKRLRADLAGSPTAAIAKQARKADPLHAATIAGGRA